MRVVTLGIVLCLSAAVLQAETAQERLQDSTEVLNEVMSVPEKGIPRDLIEKAHCAVIIPGMKRGAFIIGGKYGRGFAVCRDKDIAGGWGAPAAVRIEGASVGAQIGGSSSDVVMLVMNERGMRELIEDKFTLGGEASVAAGPVGRTSSALTNAQLAAGILTWARSRGAFAGVALTGGTLRNDLDENQELYGRRLNMREILTSNIPPPAAATGLVSSLNRYSRMEEGAAERQAPKTRNKK